MAEVHDFIRLIDKLLFLDEVGYKLANSVRTHISAFLLPDIARGDMLNMLKKLNQERCLSMIRIDRAPGTFGYEILDTKTDAEVLLTINSNSLKVYKQELQNKYLNHEIPAAQIETISLDKEKIDFNPITGSLNFRDKNLLLTPDTTTSGLCRYMFTKMIGVPVDWSEIYESIEGSFPKNKIKDRKKIYDAMTRLNKEIKKRFKVSEDLFSSKNTTIRRNY